MATGVDETIQTVTVSLETSQSVVVSQPGAPTVTNVTPVVLPGTAPTTVVPEISTTPPNQVLLDPRAASLVVLDTSVVGPRGDTGPQGPSGPPGSMYVYQQQIAASTWTIVHNLGVYPSVAVSDSSGSEVEGEIYYKDLNTVVLTFSAAFAGTATLG